MIRYSKIINQETGLCEIADGTNIDFYKSIGMTEMNVDKSEIDGNWYLYDKCPHYSEKEKEEREKERISRLKCTKRVLALMLQQMGISYTRLKNLIATNEQAQLEWDLCIELERSNPLLDIMGAQLGITPEQLDTMFKYANGEVDALEVE